MIIVRIIKRKISNLIYKSTHKQPSFKNPEAWRKWFVASTTRSFMNVSADIERARRQNAG
jgi:hypothetical protein